MLHKENTSSQEISRKDFFYSLDFDYDDGDKIDIEECENLFVYFLEISKDPFLIILQRFKSHFSEMHKSFLIEKIETFEMHEHHFDYIVNHSSFDSLDLLTSLSTDFYKPFCKYLVSKRHYFFLENISEYPQTLEIFTDIKFWSPVPWFVLDEDRIDLVYVIIKKMICNNLKIKENFISCIKEIIKNNQDRNKMFHEKGNVISDKEAYYYNLLINKFLDTIISRNLKISKDKDSFTNFVILSKIEIFRISYIKMIEERKLLKMEDENTDEIDKILKNIVDEKRFGEYLGLMICENKNEFLTEGDDELNQFIHYKTVGAVYLYIYEFFIPDVGVLTFLFQFDIFKQQILRILIHNSDLIKFSLLNSIIDYYNKVQKEGHKIEIRHLVNLILVEKSTFSLKICLKNIKFINYLMSDFEYCLSNGLIGICEINEVLKKTANIKNSYENLELLKDLSLDIRRLKNKISSSFIFIETCFRLLFKIIDTNVDILIVDELIEVFVKILNCNLKTIVGPKCSELVFKNPFTKKDHPFSRITRESLKFNPKELLRNILLIYIEIKSVKFIKSVAKEEMYYDLNLFNVGLEICENKFLLNNLQIDNLKVFIKKLEQYTQDATEEFDANDAFIDPLTFNVIKDPVKLLTSNVTIDKSTYNMIMLNDAVDPFNRLPLDDTKVVEDVEMKKSIQLKYKTKNNNI